MALKFFLQYPPRINKCSLYSAAKIISGLPEIVYDQYWSVVQYFILESLMMTENLVGQEIGHFVIRELIGHGGMATVYRAYQSSVNRDVALKVIELTDSSWHDPSFQRRFTKEAEVIAALEHIHILPVFDYGITDQVAYIAMRLLRGGTLREVIKDGPLSVDRAADLFRQIARGLAYAHRKGVIHRDLKPSNIMLDDAGNALLTDFGLAKLMGDPLELTKSGNIVGTPTYMSPEQLRGDPLDHRSDIYSLGVVLYYMLVGRPPFGGTGTDLVSTIYQQLEKAPPTPSEHNPLIPQPVEAVILRALQKAPENRYQSADEMADDLYMALGRRLTSAHLEVPSHQALSHSSPTQMSTSSTTIEIQRHKFIAGIVGMILLGVGAVILALLLTRGSDDQADSRPTITPSAAVFVPTVLPGAEELAALAQPAEAEIQQAQQRLADGGFIGLIACNMSSEYHATMTREIADFIQGYGIESQVYDSNTDEYRQITEIERARADGATGLIICPLNPDLLATSLQSAQAAGIPMVFLHSDLPSYGGVLLAGDDYKMGQEAGRFAGGIIREELDGQARVIVLDYPDLPVIVVRANGLEDGLHELAPEAEVVGRYLGGTRDFGYASVKKLIEEGVAFDAILSINDAGAFGAIAAMEEAGIDSDAVFISSIDAEALALSYIRDGYYMRGSVQVSREEFSRTAVNAMIKLLAGATVPETYLVPPGDVINQANLN